MTLFVETSKELERLLNYTAGSFLFICCIVSTIINPILITRILDKTGKIRFTQRIFLAIAAIDLVKNIYMPVVYGTVLFTNVQISDPPQPTVVLIFIYLNTFVKVMFIILTEEMIFVLTISRFLSIHYPFRKHYSRKFIKFMALYVLTYFSVTIIMKIYTLTETSHQCFEKLLLTFRYCKDSFQVVWDVLQTIMIVKLSLEEFTAMALNFTLVLRIKSSQINANTASESKRQQINTTRAVFCLNLCSLVNVIVLIVYGYILHTKNDHNEEKYANEFFVFLAYVVLPVFQGVLNPVFILYLTRRNYKRSIN